jgi:LPXTG-motif cell wall-anchored protein
MVSPNSEQLFAVSLIFVASVGIVMTAISLFVYFKKRKH